MKPSRIVGSAFVVVWAFLAVEVALAYQAPDRISTWVGRAVIMLVAALAWALVVVSVRALWRGLWKAWTRPWPDGRVNGWLLRQPAWRVAIAACVLYGLLIVGGWLAVALVTHHSPSVLPLLLPMIPGLVPWVGQLLVARSRWRRQGGQKTGPAPS